MPSPRARMQDVVLEEAGDDVPGAPADGNPGPGGPATRGSRGGRRRWWVAVAVLAVVAVAGTAQGDEPVPALPPGVEGALAPVDRPLTELWRMPARSVSGLAVVDGLLVGALVDAEGSADVVGLDPVSGAEAWRTRVLDGGPLTGRVRCVTPGAPADDPAGPDAGDGVPAPRVTACVVVDELRPLDGFTRPGEQRPASVRLVIVDAADGSVLHDAAAPPTTTVAALGPDLVRSDVDDEGLLRVSRTDATARTVRWSFTGPEPLPETRYGMRAWVTTRDDLVLAGGDTGWVLTADGAVVHTWRPRTDGAGWAEVVADGLLAQPAPAQRVGPGGDQDGDEGGDRRDDRRDAQRVDRPAGDPDADPESAVVEIVELATGRTSGVQGLPVLTSVDDGSTPGLVLVRQRGESVAGYDGTTGRESWRIPDEATSAALVVDGRVVLAGEDSLTALDAVTGERLWSTPVRRVSRVGPVTDGRLVLTGRPHPTDGMVLGAYGIDDGRLRWDTDVPNDVNRLRVADGRLFALTPYELVALG
ncbi:PQQ-binding-like beta-propeller repeat protein [Cellulomonas sp. ATA003]|uniref:outer membrane protein assembly factor BamB family protein n=1 Tax=Cellulomonas sp. ATA003 TaxID=3073064 RepID=UPI002873A1F9|nr:PQQ-binding-like beta-propeller repeat protein [Cellulomonas sp. ATA003]WNB84370.1 PQQ-binding-like beta-propeller repeat protein [Cellulomonas sp. ATA003]